MNKQPPYQFRLYIAGETPNSAQALGNLQALCRAHLPGQHAIEIVDVFREPKQALTNGILMTPTLVKLAPAPAIKIVGTLSQPACVLQALGLETVTA